MSWYIWTIFSMIAGSLEEVIDKVILIKNPEKFDPLVAAFYRNLGFLFFTFLSGLIGIFGELNFIFNFQFLILAILWPVNSFAYDYFLRKVELSRVNSFFYSIPIIFFVFDSIFFHANFSIHQVIGILLIAVGSTLFSFDYNSKNFVLSLKGVILLLLKISINVYLLIVFKLYSNSINEVSFYFSIWVLVIIGYLILLLFTKKYKGLFSMAKADGFLVKTFFSKGFDFLSGIFYLEALNLTYLTNVSALSSFSPFILLAILFLISFFTKIKIQENFSKNILVFKATATLIIVLGGMCVILF